MNDTESGHSQGTVPETECEDTDDIARADDRESRAQGGQSCHIGAKTGH